MTVFHDPVLDILEQRKFILSIIIQTTFLDNFILDTRLKTVNPVYKGSPPAIFCCNIINTFYSKSIYAHSTLLSIRSCKSTQSSVPSPRKQKENFGRTEPKVSSIRLRGFYCCIKLSFTVFYAGCYLEFTIYQFVFRPCSILAHLGSNLCETQSDLLY